VNENKSLLYIPQYTTYVETYSQQQRVFNMNDEDHDKNFLSISH